MNVCYLLPDVVDIELEKEDEDEEPTLEGRGHHIEITTETITTSTPKPTLPQTVDQCHLPYYPATDPDLENEWRFGT